MTSSFDAEAPALPAAGLPRLVRTYLSRARPEGPPPSRVRITQTGQMWTSPRSRPLRFTAVQEFEVRRVSFSWRARMPLAGPLAWISVIDECTDGRGALNGRLWGLVRVIRAEGPDVDRGEISRYLSELMWNPFATTENPDLSWRQIDERTVGVTAHVAGRLVAPWLSPGGPRRTECLGQPGGRFGPRRSRPGRRAGRR